MDGLQHLLGRVSLTPWDVVDILAVAILFYEGLKLIRGTRAVQVLLGSSIILALYLLSQQAPLYTLNWLVRNFVGYFVFAAIVVFQSDIRRALAHLGRAQLFRRFSRSETGDDTIEEAVVAATLLADKRTGAIIVFERAIGLRNYIESGIPLDAAVTHDLIVSVFQTTSPMHDGAVILLENRVAAASCFLPLTVNPQLSRELGTRHRAAIGLTEETDAVAVIVSEESGKISLAVDGGIERGLSADRLRVRLKNLMKEGRADQRRRQRGKEQG
ncbi:MAG: integrity scanning protein DisA [Acidobacteria bacterium]|jgi:diadenylate cyclase|nr:integrity scanning protein DisA [Acidobacteriota bacterium]